MLQIVELFIIWMTNPAISGYAFYLIILGAEDVHLFQVLINF